MTRIIVDAQLCRKLLEFTGPMDLCDESGRLVGMFTPASMVPPPDYTEPPLTEEEWRRRQDQEDFSTEEVLARLEGL